MKKNIVFIFLILSIFTAFSKNNTSITGKVIDRDTKEAVPQANIRILQQRDSAYVNGVATDTQGNFNMNIAKGRYILQITYIGYNHAYRNIEVLGSSKKMDLGTIELSTDNILLQAAIVTAKAPEIVVKGDTLEFNADSYKVTESAVVEDILKKMPGVEVDSEGKITINGREVKKIMIDGEEFFSSDPKIASKNLPAKMVDKLQVLDRRSDMSLMTGFDDGEEETVINLTVKPGMKEGLLGNAFAGYGSNQRYEANAMINYMKNRDQYTFLGGINNTNNAGFTDFSSSMFDGMRGGRGRRFMGGDGITESANAGLNFAKQVGEKLKFGGNIRFGNTDNNTISKIHTLNLLNNGNTIDNEKSESNSSSNNFNMDFRFEWKPDTLTEIVFQPSASIYNNRKKEVGEFFTAMEISGDTINFGNSSYNSKGYGKEISSRLDVSRKLSDTGRVLSFQFRGNLSDSENVGENKSNTFYSGSHPNDIINQQFTNRNNSKSWRGYVSYVEPIGNKNFIQLAYTFRQNFSESDKDTRVKDEDNNYTILDKDYSKRLENNFTRQEIELNFQSIREKYDYRFGFSVQPASSKSKTFIGDSLINPFKQNVTNYAPMAQFNYRWSRQHNLRIRYFGYTDQPTVEQLSPVVDISNPLNVTYGNPDLKPSFQHRFNIRYQNFNAEKGASIAMFSNFSYLTNDIVTSTMINQETGRRISTFENVRGNWSADMRFMVNLPLKNIKYSIFSMSFVNYNNTNGFVNNEKNLSRRTNLFQVLGLNYRSDIFDFTLRGNINFNKVNNSILSQQNQEYFNYGSMGNTTIYLPWDMSIESDISYRANSGYADGFSQQEWLWNASIQKQLFKQKNGTIRFKIYDILQQRSNVSRSVTANYIRDTTTNALTSYFMFHFVYKFNIFKGGATKDDMNLQQGRFGPPAGGGRRF